MFTYHDLLNIVSTHLIFKILVNFNFFAYNTAYIEIYKSIIDNNVTIVSSYKDFLSQGSFINNFMSIYSCNSIANNVNFCLINIVKKNGSNKLKVRTR